MDLLNEPDMDKDKLFEPTVDMMVNDFDDEQTLEEEEKMAAEDPEVVQRELSNLQHESDLPLEELLRLYNCPPPARVGRRSDKHKSRKRRRGIVATVIDEADCSAIENSETTTTTTSTTINNVNNNNHVDAENNSAINIEEVSDEQQVKRSRKDVLSTDEYDGKEIPDEYESGIKGKCEEVTPGDDPVLGVTEDNDEEEEEDEDEEDDDDDEPSELIHLLQTAVENDEDDEESVDYDYYPEEALELKKVILVGEEHQATIPDLKCNAIDGGHNEDKLMWSPFDSQLNEPEVESFLARCSKLRPTSRAHNQTDETPTTVLVKDDEKMLLKLLEADFKIDIALEQIRILSSLSTSVPNPNNGSCGSSGAPWSEEECRSFELGIRLYGKNFSLIQQTKVNSRTVAELVQFYYMWKKTERYDVFAAKQRLEKKKHVMGGNHNLTEFMDKFLEEQQQRAISPRYHSNNVNTKPTSSNASPTQLPTSLSVGGTMGEDHGHSLLIYADSKRHRGTTPLPDVNQSVPVCEDASCKAVGEKRGGRIGDEGKEPSTSTSS